MSCSFFTSLERRSDFDWILVRSFQEILTQRGGAWSDACMFR
jgi:hypothetical protein